MKRKGPPLLDGFPQFLSDKKLRRPERKGNLSEQILGMVNTSFYAIFENKLTTFGDRLP
jgi:hypothetical protein